MPWGPKGARPRILIIEDDPMVLELITTRLELAGFQTFYARNGAEGLNRINELRPDGMVLDINLPVMDGFAVLSHLKSIGSFYPPTLVLTARNKPEDVKAAIIMGARDFLSKPFKDDQLLARVGRLVRKPLSTGSIPQPTPRDGQTGSKSTSRVAPSQPGPPESGYETIEI